MRRAFPNTVPALVTLALWLAIPSQAEAQGWRWIRKLSGPEYPFVPTARFTLCLEGGKITCLAAGPGDLPDRHRFKFETGTNVGYSFGVGGNNDEAGIADTSVLTLDFPMRVVWPRAWNHELRLMPVGSVGYGLNRFSGGTIPETFWQSSIVITVGGRYPNPELAEWKIGASTSVYVEGGVELRRYLPALANEDFGATNATGELDPWGLSIYGSLIFQWNRPFGIG